MTPGPAAPRLSSSATSTNGPATSYLAHTQSGTKATIHENRAGPVDGLGTAVCAELFVATQVFPGIQPAYQLTKIPRTGLPTPTRAVRGRPVYGPGSVDMRLFL